jgi:hypothetical protein
MVRQIIGKIVVHFNREYNAAIVNSGLYIRGTGITPHRELLNMYFTICVYVIVCCNTYYVYMYLSFSLRYLCITCETRGKVGAPYQRNQ